MTDLPIAPLLPGWLTLVAAGGLALAFLALLVAIVAVRRERRLKAHYEALMTGVDGEDLAAALEAYTARLAAGEERIGVLEGRLQDVSTSRVEVAEGRIDDVDARLRRALQRVRLLRYSAFEDAGGDQSFALALLDDGADGVVMSGLYGRGGVRVYAKPVLSGRSTYALTTEEERVIAEALEAPENG